MAPVGQAGRSRPKDRNVQEAGALDPINWRKMFQGTSEQDIGGRIKSMGR